MGTGLWLSLVRLGQGNCGERIMVITSEVRVGELWGKGYGYH